MITLGKRVYEPVDTGSYTLAYELYMDQVLDESGITAALSALPEKADEATRQAGAKAGWVALVQSGKAAVLIAGLIKPTDGPWTPKWAANEAPMLDALTAREDHRTMTELLLVGITTFFNVGPRF